MFELTRRERKKEATRVNITETAIRLFTNQGFGETTMNQIAEEADVSLGTLYNYFPSKEAIVGYYMKWVVDQHYEGHWDKVLKQKSTYSRLWYVLQLAARWSQENKELTEVYVADPRNYYYGPTWDQIPRSGFDEIFEDLLQRGQELGDINKGYEAKLLARQMMGTFYIATLAWFANPEESTLETKYQEGLDLFFQGCRPCSGGGNTWETLKGFF